MLYVHVHVHDLLAEQQVHVRTCCMCMRMCMCITSLPSSRCEHAAVLTDRRCPPLAHARARTHTMCVCMYAVCVQVVLRVRAYNRLGEGEWSDELTLQV